MDDKQNVTDQILDLLLDALLEHQRTREAADRPPEVVEASVLPSFGKTPLKSPLVATETDDNGKMPPDGREALHFLDETTLNASNEPIPNGFEREIGDSSDRAGELSLRAAWDSQEDAEDFSEIEDEPLPEPLPMMGLGRMLGRLALILFLILVVVNIPYNRFGTSLARAMPDEASLIIRDGLVLKGSGERIYVLEDNKLRWISSLDAFDYFGYRWGQVRLVSDDFLADFEEGRPVHLLLKCQSSPHIYALEDGRKRWIKDIPTFEERGYVWEDVKFVSCAELRNLPNGVTIPADAGRVPEP
jgi:hypothetical protein